MDGMRKSMDGWMAGWMTAGWWVGDKWQTTRPGFKLRRSATRSRSESRAQADLLQQRIISWRLASPTPRFALHDEFCQIGITFFNRS